MGDRLNRTVEGPWNHGSFSVSCSREPRPDLAESLWSLYEGSFGPLRLLAPARQVLTQSEFAAELLSPRVWKYEAVDAQGEPVGLTTLTDDISTMPWISAEYFAHHYPDEWQRRAIFYVGVTLVSLQMRTDRVFAMMSKHVAHRVTAAQGVLGYDMCGYNETRSLARATAQILNRVADFQVDVVDTQTYYVARATGGTHEEQ